MRIFVCTYWFHGVSLTQLLGFQSVVHQVTIPCVVRLYLMKAMLVQCDWRGVSDCVRCRVVGIQQLGEFNMCSYSSCVVLLCSQVGVFVTLRSQVIQNMLCSLEHLMLYVPLSISSLYYRDPCETLSIQYCMFSKHQFIALGTLVKP